MRDVTFTIEPGERVLLLGASGAGKSTLLHGLAGVLGGADEGEAAGTLRLDGRTPAAGCGIAGLVMQDPDSQVVMARVGDDVAFGPENLGVDRDDIWRRVEASLADVGLDVGLHHRTTHLSGGQRQRLVLAGVLAMRPGLLLLDEPTANLDPAGVAEVREAVGRALADRRATLIVVEHRTDIWVDLVDRVIILDVDGGLAADGPPPDIFAAHGPQLEAAGVWVPRRWASPRPDVELASAASDPILGAQDLTIGWGATPVHTATEIGIEAGSSTVLTGANGSGKTTLALTLAGLLAPLGGRPWAAPSLVPPRRTSDPGTWRSTELLTRIGTVFQNAEHQFVAATVREELAVGLRALERPTVEIDARVSDLLARLRLEHLAKAHPFTLSGGEKRRLSVATVLVTAPSVVFLDEPTFGQDRRTWLELVDIIAGLQRDGTTVISVTHDADYSAAVGQRRIELA